MATKESIWNMALGLLGAEPVTSVDENTRVANACRTFYEPMKLHLLRSHNWNFAITRSTLTSDGVPAFEYKYSYTLPNDYLRIVSFYNYKGAFKEEGGKLLLDQASVQVKYVKKDVEEANFDSSFEVCLASRLAMAIAFQITQSSTSVQMAAQTHKEDLAVARRNNAISNTPDSFQEDVWLTTRL